MSDFKNTDKANNMFGENTSNNKSPQNGNLHNFRNKQPNSAIPSQGIDKNNDAQKEQQEKAKERAKERAKKARQKASDTADAVTPTIGSKILLAVKKVGRIGTNTVKGAGKMAKNAYGADSGVANGSGDALIDSVMPSGTVIKVGAVIFFLAYIITYWNHRFIPDMNFNQMDNQMYNEESIKDDDFFEDTDTVVVFRENYDGEENLDDFNSQSPMYNGADAAINGIEQKDEND